MSKLVSVTPKYKYFEALSIIKNSEKYNPLAVSKAKELVKEYEKANPCNYKPVTDEERAEIMAKYPDAYKRRY